jgi:hypothetical protein
MTTITTSHLSFYFDILDIQFYVPHPVPGIDARREHRGDPGAAPEPASDRCPLVIGDRIEELTVLLPKPQLQVFVVPYRPE